MGALKLVKQMRVRSTKCHGSFMWEHHMHPRFDPEDKESVTPTKGDFLEVQWFGAIARAEGSDIVLSYW